MGGWVYVPVYVVLTIIDWQAHQQNALQKGQKRKRKYPTRPGIKPAAERDNKAASGQEAEEVFLNQKSSPEGDNSEEHKDANADNFWEKTQ